MDNRRSAGAEYQTLSEVRGATVDPSGEGTARYHSIEGDLAFGGLHEHPAVALDVRRRVEPSEREVLRLAEDRRSCRLRPLVVGVEMVDLDVNAVDHPR